jgi:dihydroorotase
MKQKKSASVSVNPRPNSLLIRGGYVIDPAGGAEGELDLLLQDGRVAKVAARGQAADAAETLDARGLIVAPGFVDLHVHLREPGQTYKETIATGTAAAAAGGFTSVCAMPNTAPVNDAPELTAWMRQPERGAVVNVFPIAAVTEGSNGERLTDFAALQRAGAVAFSDDGRPVLDGNLMRDALTAAARLGLPIVQHAEDTRLTAGGQLHDGPTAFRLGLRGMPAAAETTIVERDIELARVTGAHLHVAHVSAASAIEAIRRGKRQGVRVTCEVTPHHFTLADSDLSGYDTRFKMNPPLRSAADREALWAGLADGTVDAIATDHAPHAMHEKLVEFDRAPFGVIGLETALALAITVLHRGRHLPLRRIVELLSANPARLFKLEGRGSLAPGAHADLVLFDPRRRWTCDAARTRSKSRNTPFDGTEFHGKVMATVADGVVVYRGD